MLRPLLGRFLFTSLLLALLASPTALEAQPIPEGSEFAIDTTTFQPEGDIDMASDGSATVVWNTDTGILAQDYDSDGNADGTSFQVSSSTQTYKGFPAVSLADDDSMMVVWLEVELPEPPALPSSEIVARRYDAMGAPIGDPFTVFSSENRTFAPDIAHAPGGNAIVTWKEELDPMTGESAVRFQRYAADGSLLGSTVTVTPPGVSIPGNPRVVTAPDGSFIIGVRPPFGAYCVHRYTTGGTALDTGLCRGGPNVGNGGPAIGIDSDGSFFVLWTADHPSDGLHGQRYDNQGNLLGSSFLVTGTLPGAKLEMGGITKNPSGGFIVVFSEGTANYSNNHGHDGSAATVMAVEVTRSGAAAGPLFQVNDLRTEGDQVPDAVARDGDGNFTVVFTDKSFSGGGLFARRYGPSGNTDPNPDPALVGHWRLDEGSGPTAFDASGNGLNGTIEGSGFSWSLGQQGESGLFDADDNHVIRIVDGGPSSAIDLDNALTLALWVQPHALDGSAQVLLSKDEVYELGFNRQGSNRWDLRLDNQGAITAHQSLEEGVWQHLAVTWDGTTACAFVDGLLDHCEASSVTAPLPANTFDLGLGARPSVSAGGTPLFPFTGGLDELRVYDRAFTETEIAQLVLAELNDVSPPTRSGLAPASSLPIGTTSATLSLDTGESADCRYSTLPGTFFYDSTNTMATSDGFSHSANVAVNNGETYFFYVRCRDARGNLNGDDAVIAFGVGDSSLCNGMVSAWQLDEGAGCTAADTHGSNDATLGPGCPSDGPWWFVGEGGGAALFFDGSNDVVSVASPSGLSPLDEVTLSAWIQHDASGIFRSIIDRRDSGSDGFDLYLSAASKAFARFNTYTLEANTVVADGQWHHVVAVLDVTSEFGAEIAKIRIYVDGQLDAERNILPTTVETSGALFLGQRFATLQNPLSGSLDRVSIHDRALSAVEVLDLYIAGVPSCSP